MLSFEDFQEVDKLINFVVNVCFCSQNYNYVTWLDSCSNQLRKV